LGVTPHAHETLAWGTELPPEPVTIGSLNRLSIELAVDIVVLKLSLPQLSYGVPIGAVILLWPIPRACPEFRGTSVAAP
jgi:hypothetical protein